MISLNSIDLLPRDGALSAYINLNHDHISRYKSHYQKDKLGRTGEKILFWRHD